MVVLFCIFGVCKESKQKRPLEKRQKKMFFPYEIFLKRANTFYSALPTLYSKYWLFFYANKKKEVEQKKTWVERRKIESLSVWMGLI